MSVTAELSATRREETGKGAARRLRASGRVPGVVYSGTMETIPISVDAGEAEYLFRSISVENTLVDLKLESEDEPYRTLVREIQAHPHKAELIHVDFYVITEGQTIEVQIPIHLNGTPEGVRESGGVLEQIVHDLPVKCVPAKIPESIEIDVTDVGMNEAIHVSDVDLGEDVEILLDPERTICTVVAPKVLVVEAEEEEEELEVELISEEEAAEMTEEELEAAREAAREAAEAEVEVEGEVEGEGEEPAEG